MNLEYEPASEPLHIVRNQTSVERGRHVREVPSLPGKENSSSHRARPVHQIISMLKRIRTNRVSIKNSLPLSLRFAIIIKPAACEQRGNTLHKLKTFTWNPRPESGLDCLTCAIFFRQRAIEPRDEFSKLGLLR